MPKMLHQWTKTQWEQDLGLLTGEDPVGDLGTLKRLGYVLSIIQQRPELVHWQRDYHRLRILWDNGLLEERR